MTRTFSARPAMLRLESLEDRLVPATFNVTTTLDVIDPADGKRSLREAITAANTSAGSDVIVLHAGVYKIAILGAGEEANQTGDFDLTDSTTFQGIGLGSTFVDAQRNDRVFDIRKVNPAAITVVFQGVTIRNGGGLNDGGGIRLDSANLVVRDSALVGNRALQGGGISNGASVGTDVRVIRSTVTRNVANSDGGGLSVLGAGSVLTVKDSSIRRNVSTTITASGGGLIATSASLTNTTVSGNRVGLDGGGMNVGTANLSNCIVSGNSAGRNGGGIIANTLTLTGTTVTGNVAAVLGGGALAISTATLTNSTVSNNSATEGGGVLSNSTATLTNVTVSGNVASTTGGGVRSVTATLTGTTVSGNFAGTAGGGINATTALLTNSTISGNTAVTDGGGIFAGTATLLNCTVVENLALNGGGIFHGAGGAFSLKNCLVALNVIGFNGNGVDISGAFASGGHNLVGDGSGGTGFTNGVSGDIVGSAVNPIDPRLGPLANNGGRTKTHALKPGSLATDHGDNAGVPATDQRGPAQEGRQLRRPRGRGYRRVRAVSPSLQKGGCSARGASSAAARACKIRPELFAFRAVR